MDYPPERDGAPMLELGGRSWSVPLLAARQNRLIDPLILSLLPLFAQWQQDKAAALAQLGAPQYEALQEIAYQALRRAYPEMTRDAFLDLPVTLSELLGAFPVIARQTGLFEKAGPGETPTGEAGAGISPPNHAAPTGTPSSPISAT